MINISIIKNKLNLPSFTSPITNFVIFIIKNYYCFIDNGESNQTILNVVSNLDDFYIKEHKIYNRITQETKLLKKDEIYSFCIAENYDYSSFLRMIKGRFKSYKNWIL